MGRQEEYRGNERGFDGGNWNNNNNKEEKDEGDRSI